MRLMTTNALRVTLVDLSALGRVTALTAGHRQLGMVREPDMAPFAGLVTCSMGCASQLSRVTTLAGAVIGERPDEVVGRMTTLAFDARVERRVFMRGLMARAAGAGALFRMPETGMRIVATHA